MVLPSAHVVRSKMIWGECVFLGERSLVPTCTQRARQEISHRAGNTVGSYLGCYGLPQVGCFCCRKLRQRAILYRKCPSSWDKCCHPSVPILIISQWYILTCTHRSIRLRQNTLPRLYNDNAHRLLHKPILRPLPTSHPVLAQCSIRMAQVSSRWRHQ